ncbi:MAG: ABC transporter ATP-binding protein [Chromatiaceae bacterium]|jgi:ATP-binding cassette subfamily C protein
MLDVARAYPVRTLITLIALIVAGIVQGLSLTALLPMLQIALDPEAAASQLAEFRLVQMLMAIGLTPGLGILLIVFVLGMVSKSLLVLLANRHVGYTVAQIATDLRLKLLSALVAARWDYFLHQPIGSLANAMATETVRASTAYLNGARTFALFIETLAYSLVAFTVSWQVTLIALGVGALLFFLFGGLIRKARKAGRRQTRLFASLLARLTDTLQSVKALKSMALVERVSAVQEAETGKLNHALRRQVFSEEVLRALQESMIVSLVAIGLYAAVTFLVIPIASIMVLIILLVRVLNAAGKLQRSYQKMATQESAYFSLMNAIHNAERARETGGSEVPSFTREIRLDRVEFAIGGKAILRDVSLTIPAGSFTTLVGPSGSGKTTVIDLVTGLQKATGGRILVDGSPLDDLNLEQWRHLIGYVAQEILLLHDSVLNNVTLGDPELSEADAEAALRAAGAWDFVAAMPEGLHTAVGERGGKLSGGQRQRLCIARALVRRPSLLILDEATSALDPASEAALCETLGDLRGNITILAVSHQSGLADIADRVIRMEHGMLVGQAG